MILNKNLFLKASTSIIKFFFENRLFLERCGMEAVLQAEYSDALIKWLSFRPAYGKVSTGCQESSCKFSLVYDTQKYHRNAVQ